MYKRQVIHETHDVFRICFLAILQRALDLDVEMISFQVDRLVNWLFIAVNVFDEFRDPVVKHEDIFGAGALVDELDL